MAHLNLQDDNFTWPGFSLLGESNLAITMDDTGVLGNVLNFLVLSGTTSVSVASNGVGGKGFNQLSQLLETTNNLTTVTVSGSENLQLGFPTFANSGDGVVTDIAATAASPIKIHSSLTLIDASTTTGELDILAGATNSSGSGIFKNGGSLNANVTITYTGLTIKGGSGRDVIENDANKGVVIESNTNNDEIFLGGAGAKATLGTGINDEASVGLSFLGTNETAGSALGDSVKFGNASGLLAIGTGAEAGSTAGTTNIGLTKVLKAADGMGIDFERVTTSNNIADETAAVASAATLTAAKNAAVKALGSAGVAFFNFGGSEYLIATNHTETAVSSDDAIVKLVGVQDLNHPTIAAGLVTLHV